MKRVRTKIGDLFSVKINEKDKKYFQLVAFDLTQLNSDVIRVFKKIYPIDYVPNFSGVVESEVEFYAHCITKIGLKMGYWEKVGYLDNIGSTDGIIFRSSEDDPQTKISKNWWVWKINHELKKVGELEGENRNAEIGSVIPPDSLVHRIRTGEYDFIYPDFK